MAVKANGVVQRKFALLDKYLLNLEQSLANVSLEKFIANWGLQRLTERSLQVMIEIVIDISERFLALNNAGPASSAAETLEKLVQLNIIQSAEPYRSMVRFRNLIVHQYEEINPNLLYDLAKNKLGDFRKFRNEVDRYI